jgi:FixJ family two-component response regulator
MKQADAVVYVIDDDRLIRNGLESLIKSVGHRVHIYSSASEFMQMKRSDDAPACLVLDVRMPGQSGLDLQRELTQAGIHTPIIFITGRGDIPMTVRAMREGAVEFLTKPVRSQDLLDAIERAIAQDRMQRKEQKEFADLRKRFESLTHRETEVLGLVVEGLLNKQIADQLGATEPTIKIHRARVMEKTGAESLAHLVRMFERLKRSISK